MEGEGQWKMNEGKLKNSRPPWVEAVITLPFFSPHPSLPRQTKFWQCCPPVAPTLHFLSIISLFLRHVPAHTCWLALSASWSLTLSRLEGPHWEPLKKPSCRWHVIAVLSKDKIHRLETWFSTKCEYLYTNHAQILNRGNLSVGQITFFKLIWIRLVSAFRKTCHYSRINW